MRTCKIKISLVDFRAMGVQPERLLSSRRCCVAVRASSWSQVLVIFFDEPLRSCRRCCSRRVVPRRSASDRAGPHAHVRLSRGWAAASPQHPECLWRSHRRLGVGLPSARGRIMMCCMDFRRLFACQRDARGRSDHHVVSCRRRVLLQVIRC